MPNIEALKTDLTMATGDKYLEQFQRGGYTILEGLIDLRKMRSGKDSFTN